MTSLKQTLASIADSTPVIVMAGWEPKWREESRCTLGEFFASNSVPEDERDAIRSSLAEGGQHEIGGGFGMTKPRTLRVDPIPLPERDWVAARAAGCQEDQ